MKNYNYKEFKVRDEYIMKFNINTMIKVVFFIILFVVLTKIAAVLHSKIFIKLPLWLNLIILIPFLVIIFRWDITKDKISK